MSDTTTTEPIETTPAATAAPNQGDQGRSRGSARKARMAIIGVLIVGLLVSWGGRHWAMALQRHAYLTGPYAPIDGGADGDEPVNSAGPTLGSLDSYFLILVLGGLRGPLVMFLWTSSENQKNERDLEDFDTKVELIRLLQPEFDSVHIFQMWNKAYNISAQLSSLPNKYSVILDAVAYGKNVDRARPNNLNILLELNKIFQHKLGTTTTDSVYYRRMVRQDSKWRETKDEAIGALDRRMDPVLDPQDNVLPELVRARKSRPAGQTARIVLPVKSLDALKSAAKSAGVTLPPDQISPPEGARELALSVPEADARKLDPLLRDDVTVRFVYTDWNDGSDLQYLKRYEPYPYGVSPLALGFNYAKRAQVLMNQTGQRPAQTGPSVVDSRPGLELRHWAEEEWDRAMVAEARAFGRPIMNKRHEMLIPTASVLPNAAPLDPAAIEEALYSYKLARELLRDSRAEYTRHLLNTTEGIRRMQDYTSHLDALEADELTVTADLRYLQAILATDTDRKRSLLAEADEKYRQARARYAALDFQFYSPGDLEYFLFAPPPEQDRLIPNPLNLLAMAGFPAGMTRDNPKDFIDQPEAMRDQHDFFVWGMQALQVFDQNDEARFENAHFMLRIDFRRNIIAQALNRTPPPMRPILGLWPPPEVVRPPQ